MRHRARIAARRVAASGATPGHTTTATAPTAALDPARAALTTAWLGFASEAMSVVGNYCSPNFVPPAVRASERPVDADARLRTLHKLVKDSLGTFAPQIIHSVADDVHAAKVGNCGLKALAAASMILRMAEAARVSVTVSLVEFEDRRYDDNHAAVLIGRWDDYGVVCDPWGRCHGRVPNFAANFRERMQYFTEQGYMLSGDGDEAVRPSDYAAALVLDQYCDIDPIQ